MKIRSLLVVLAGLAASGGAYADAIMPNTGYDLANHPDGSERPPGYGLRLDGLISGDGSDVYTFDFEAKDAGMHMFWHKDDETNELNISGRVFGGLDNGTGYEDGRYWDVDFTYTGLYSCFGDALCSNAGSGSIDSSGFGSFALSAYSGSHDYAFRLDTGHRGFAGISGWGWLNHCYADGASADDGNIGADCGQHVYSSDWLFTATKKVPEPGTLGLLGLGLFGMSLARRKRHD